MPVFPSGFLGFVVAGFGGVAFMLSVLGHVVFGVPSIGGEATFSVFSAFPSGFVSAFSALTFIVMIGWLRSITSHGMYPSSVNIIVSHVI